MDPRTLFSGRVGRERRDGQRGSLKIESICAAELEIQIRRGTSPARRTFHSIIDTQRERERERECNAIFDSEANRFDCRSREKKEESSSASWCESRTTKYFSIRDPCIQDSFFPFFPFFPFVACCRSLATTRRLRDHFHRVFVEFSLVFLAANFDVYEMNCRDRY